MGLVFFGKQISDRNCLTLHKQPDTKETVISKRAVKQFTCNSKPVKKLSTENLLFLKSIGLLKNKK